MDLQRWKLRRYEGHLLGTVVRLLVRSRGYEYPKISQFLYNMNYLLQYKKKHQMHTKVYGLRGKSYIATNSFCSVLPKLDSINEITEHKVLRAERGNWSGLLMGERSRQWNSFI